jgi:hypothetical protein
MRTRVLAVASTLLPLALGSCGLAIQSGAGFSGNLEPPRSMTFSWNQAGDRVVGDARLENNPIFEERLHEAIEWELSLRGIRRMDSAPDLLVHHHLTLRDHEMAEEIVDDLGYSTTEVYSFEEGTVVVHLTNARTGQTVWVAWAQATVEPALAGPEAMRTWVYDVVKEMFKGWPVMAR